MSDDVPNLSTLAVEEKSAGNLKPDFGPEDLGFGTIRLLELCDELACAEMDGQAAPRPPEFLKGGWFFSVLGTLISIPVGVRRKSLAPLVFFSSTGAMLDIILATQYHEWQKDEQDKLAREAAQKALEGDSDVIQRDELHTEELK